jgi:hypothetical protein
VPAAPPVQSPQYRDDGTTEQLDQRIALHTQAPRPDLAPRPRLIQQLDHTPLGHPQADPRPCPCRFRQGHVAQRMGSSRPEDGCLAIIGRRRQ